MFSKWKARKLLQLMWKNKWKQPWKNPSLWKHRGGFFWHCNRSKHPIPCQKCLSMQIFAGISPIRKEIFALFRQKAPDFIASWWKSSGNSYEKNPSLWKHRNGFFVEMLYRNVRMQRHQVQCRKFLSVQILAATRPIGNAMTINAALVSHSAPEPTSFKAM